MDHKTSDPGPSPDLIRREGNLAAVKTSVYFALALALLIILAFEAFTTYQNYQRIRANEVTQDFIRQIALDNNALNTDAKKAAEDAARSAKLIRSCVTPKGECAQRQARQTSELLGFPTGPINTVVVLAIACADVDGVQTDRQIVRCVEEKLKVQRRIMAQQGEKR